MSRDSVINQEKAWDKVSKAWKTFRAKPLQEVADFLKNKQGKVLDLGCGSGRNFANIKNGEIYAVDFSRQQLKYAGSYAKKHRFNAKTIKAYAHKLPFKNNFFDAAIFIAALHCIPEAKRREKALKELRRVLKKGSKAMIAVWDKNQPRFAESKKEVFIPWKYNGKKYMRYYYLYDKDELLNLLKEADFKIVKLFKKAKTKGLYSSRNIVVIARK